MRLKDINIQRWTAVPVSDWFGAGVISFYLGNEHPLLGVFDADLFIDDLVSGEQCFCSPLLVSTLLAWACVSANNSLLGGAASLTISPGNVCAGSSGCTAFFLCFPRGGKGAMEGRSTV
jgi:hypothetical protein